MEPIIATRMIRDCGQQGKILEVMGWNCKQNRGTAQIARKIITAVESKAAVMATTEMAIGAGALTVAARICGIGEADGTNVAARERAPFAPRWHRLC